MKNPFYCLLLAAGFVLLVHPTKAQEYSNIRIVSLSFVQGVVNYQRPGEDWQNAGLSLPIQEGFTLRTADGYAEVEFESSLKLRLATNSTVEFTGLALRDGFRLTQLTIPQGTASISADLKRGDVVSVAAPNMDLNLSRYGRFRLDISPAGSWVRVLEGQGDVSTPAGISSHLHARQTLHVDANGFGSPEVASNPPHDDFDNWYLIVKRR